MKFTIKREPFLQALGDLAAAIPARTPLPMLTGVLLNAEASQTLSLVCDSTLLRLETTVECRADRLGKVVVSHSKLSNLLQRDFADVSLETVDDGKKVEITLGSLKAKVEALPAADFPAPRCQAGHLAFGSADPVDLGRAMQIASKSLGDGKAHAWDEGLAIEDDGQALQIMAGDGKTLCRVLLPTTDAKFAALLPGRTAAMLARAIHDSESCSFTIHETYIHITGTAFSADLSLMNMKYGPVASTAERLNQDLLNKVTVNREALLAALQTAQAVLEIGDYFVILAIEPGVLRVSANSSTGGTFDEAVDIAKTTSPLPAVKLSHERIIAHLRAVAADQLDLYYAPGAPAIRITPEDQADWNWYLALVHG